MDTRRSRRAFLADVSRVTLSAALGAGVAQALGVGPALAAPVERLTFGALEPLVSRLQETGPDRILQLLISDIAAGTDLKRLVAAGALANARAFGGEDYVGFHTMFALVPALKMSQALCGPEKALPVFKVLYRNAARLQESGACKRDALRPVLPAELPAGQLTGEQLRAAVRGHDAPRAEAMLAALGRGSAAGTLDPLLWAVQDETEVHRVAVPSRAWDLIDVVGAEHAHTLLRESLRYCLHSESYPRSPATDALRAMLPRVLDAHGLSGRACGERQADDAWVDKMAQAIFAATPEQAADMTAGALAEGFAPEVLGEAISLAANQLALRDRGRQPQAEAPGKPVGSVHGDSVSVHGCDAANGWRKLARVAGPRNRFACTILGAYQVALDRVRYGTDLLTQPALPLADQVARVTPVAPEALIAELDLAIRDNLQMRAAAVVQKIGQLGQSPQWVFEVLLRYAISQDGALHGEKFYRTVCEEYATTRPAFRWRQVVALARVTASAYGHPAPGLDEARRLLKV